MCVPIQPVYVLDVGALAHFHPASYLMKCPRRIWVYRGFAHNALVEAHGHNLSAGLSTRNGDVFFLRWRMTLCGHKKTGRRTNLARPPVVGGNLYCCLVDSLQLVCAGVANGVSTPHRYVVVCEVQVKGVSAKGIAQTPFGIDCHGTDEVVNLVGNEVPTN